ncbi:MAG: hypothetical protein ACO289_11460 [Prochlorococcaceae cyanobacterium]
MDLLSLRTALETTLVDQLGSYRLANGARTPAISVRAPGESLPPGTTVRGLEVVIVREPELVPVRQYKNEQAFSRWTLYLVDWSGDASLQDVAGRLLWSYPGSNAVTINVPRGVGPRSQMRVDITTNPDTYAG